MITIESDGGLCELIMDEAPVNAISEEFLIDFHDALDQAEAMAPTALLIRSARKVFCAGANLKVIQAIIQSDSTVEDMITFVSKFHVLFNRIEQFPAVTMAAINGAAMGGGLELALSCDLRVVANEATVGLPEAQVGMVPGAGGTQRLTRLCGRGIANRIILGGETVDGVEAVRIGLAEKHCALTDLESIARQWATDITGLSRTALLASKHCIAAYFDNEVDGFQVELEQPKTIMRSPDAKDRIEAFFNKK